MLALEEKADHGIQKAIAILPAELQASWVSGQGAPIVMLRAWRVCALLGVLVAAGAGTLASEAAKADALLARALDVPLADVLDAVTVELDGAVLGAFGRGRRDELELAAVVSADASRSAWLGPADEIWFAGLVDLQEDGPVPLGRRTPRRLRSAGLGRPVLALLTRSREEVERVPAGGRSAPRWTGVREATRLFLVELSPELRVLVDLEIRHRSEDGFGGHRVGGLAVRRIEGRTYLEGVRQDQLPASRARCREPEPYAVRFELLDDRFRSLPEERPQVPCGAAGPPRVPLDAEAR